MNTHNLRVGASTVRVGIHALRNDVRDLQRKQREGSDAYWLLDDLMDELFEYEDRADRFIEEVDDLVKRLDEAELSCKE